MAQRLNGATAQRLNGARAQWRNGRMGMGQMNGRLLRRCASRNDGAGNINSLWELNRF